MEKFNFPCPVCCKHIEISKEDFQKGGVFKCRACGNSVRLKGHKQADDQKK